VINIIERRLQSIEETLLKIRIALADGEDEEREIYREHYNQQERDYEEDMGEDL